MKPEAQKRLRDRYRKSSTGLLLLPEDFIAEDQLDPTRAPPTSTATTLPVVCAHPAARTSIPTTTRNHAP
jgi:hypothetical protein